MVSNSRVSLPVWAASHGEREVGDGPRGYPYCPACLDLNGFNVPQQYRSKQHPECAEALKEIRNAKQP